MAKRKGVSLSVGRGEKSKKGGLTAKGRAKYNRACLLYTSDAADE